MMNPFIVFFFGEISYFFEPTRAGAKYGSGKGFREEKKKIT